jgi:integrase
LQVVRGRGRPAKGEHRKAEWVRVPTKRPRQLATVSLSPVTAAAVARHKLRLASERLPSDRWFGLLFVSPHREPISGSEVLRQFHAACDRAETEHHGNAEGECTDKCKIGIPRRRFHDLRGTSSTLLMEAGVPEDVRMLRQGHSTTKMARRYAQGRTGVDRDAADALGKALEG